MRINTWITVAGLVLLLGGCNGDDSTPTAGGGGGGETGSADAFTNSVFQVANGSSSDTAEPSEELAQSTPSTPEDAEPANFNL